MNHRRLLAGLVLGLTGLAAVPAHADRIYWSVGISAPGVTTTISNGRPFVAYPPVPVVVYPAAPVVHYPAVVYAPPPVIHVPRHVHVHRAPLAVHPVPPHRGHRHGHRHGGRH